LDGQPEGFGWNPPESLGWTQSSSDLQPGIARNANTAKKSKLKSTMARDCCSIWIVWQSRRYWQFSPASIQPPANLHPTALDYEAFLNSSRFQPVRSDAGYRPAAACFS
jgi:hypothetical protein